MSNHDLEDLIKLYANMMIYNELPFLDYVTERLLTFCDHLIIQDNGSTDGSREWLLKVCDKNERITPLVVQQTDPPHYANLRNRMLARVPNDAWVLKWDPDELPSDAMVRDLRSSLEYNQTLFRSWKVLLYHIFKSRDTCLPLDYGTHHLRLFKKVAETTWRGAIHEQPTVLKPCGRFAVPGGICIVHFSYFAEARLRRKAQHYASISGSGFRDPTRLTDRLDLTPRPLPETMLYQASDDWIEMVRSIG